MEAEAAVWERELAESHAPTAKKNGDWLREMRCYVLDFSGQHHVNKPKTLTTFILQLYIYSTPLLYSCPQQTQQQLHSKQATLISPVNKEPSK